MYIHVIFNPNQVKKPQGNKVVQYFKILNSVLSLLYFWESVFEVDIDETFDGRVFQIQTCLCSWKLCDPKFVTSIVC